MLTVVPATLATLAGLAGCGADEGVAVRVGHTTITRATVAHWMSVMAPEHVVPDPPKYTKCVAREQALALPSARAGLQRECQQEYHALKQRALDFLITAAWLAGTVGGDGAAGRLAAVSEVAEAKIRRALARTARPVTHVQIAAYYRAHRREFLVPERRYFDIENLKTPGSALNIKREVESGRSKSFASGILHEVIERPSSVDYGPAEDAVRRTIFRAKPDVLTGPLPVYGEFSLFVVRRIVPARYKPLTHVQDAIERRLAAEQQRLTLSRFIEAWRSRWIAKTDCQPGYVVQKCRQYAGPIAPEDPLAFK